MNKEMTMPDTRYSVIDAAVWSEIANIIKTSPNLEKTGQVERLNTLVRLLEFNTRHKAMINSGGI